MFQNLSGGTEENYNEEIRTEDNERNNNTKKEIFKRTFSIQNCVIYVLSFMMSMAGGVDANLFAITPFGFAMIAAAVGTQVPAILVCISSLAGIIASGKGHFLVYLLTILVFFASIMMKRPKELEEGIELNEKKKVGMHIAISVFLVQVIPMFFKTFYVYDFLYSIMLSLVTFISYKVFVNSLNVYKNLGIKKVFSMEEVIGASIIAIIAFEALGDLNILGYSIKHILDILVVLVLGWKNGVLIGATGGICVGFLVGIFENENPIIIAAYAISSMVAGMLNKLGKIGVILGFVIGNVVLSYLSYGNHMEIIRYQEILIAALGLLALPKSSGLTVADLFDRYKLLPETTGRTLEENQETISKLNNLSDTISQMAIEYGEAATTVATDKEEKTEQMNQEAFEKELKINLEDKEENILYNDIYYNVDGVLNEIFEILCQREVITRKDIIDIFAKHNNYIIGFAQNDGEAEVKKELDDIIRAINSSYRVSKLNFVLSKKINENRKSVSNQLNGVSEVISNLADQIKENTEEKYIVEKEEIKRILAEREISIKDIILEKTNEEKWSVTLYTNVCEAVDGKQCLSKKIKIALETVLKNKMILQKQECGLRQNTSTCYFKFTSDDRYSIQVGVAKSKKYDSIISYFSINSR